MEGTQLTVADTTIYVCKGGLWAIVLAALVAACSTQASPSPSAPVAPSSAASTATTAPASPVTPAPNPTPSASVTGQPPATTYDLLGMDDNRQDLSQTRALCVDDPDVNDEDGGRTMGCGAVLEVAAAVADTAFGIGVPRQMLVTRPTCTGACTADQSNRATVDTWASSGAVVRVELDGRVETATAELIDPAAARWPTPTTTEAPAVARPGIAHAPARIRDREPYPFCGTFDRADPGGDNVPLQQCFLDAVVDARPAEYVAMEYGTEGGAITELYRFAGSGSVSRDTRVDARWETQRGYLSLWPDGGGWSFEPFDE